MSWNSVTGNLYLPKSWPLFHLNALNGYFPVRCTGNNISKLNTYSLKIPKEITLLSSITCQIHGDRCDKHFCSHDYHLFKILFHHICTLECPNDPRVYAKEREDFQICNLMLDQTPELPLVPLALIILNKRVLPLQVYHLILICYVIFMHCLHTPTMCFLCNKLEVSVYSICSTILRPTALGDSHNFLITGFFFVFLHTHIPPTVSYIWN